MEFFLPVGRGLCILARMLDASPLGGTTRSKEHGAVRAFFRQHHFLLTFALLASVMGVSVGMAQVTTSLYAAELQSSASMLGLIAAAQSAGVIFMSLPVGVLADRLGPSRPFVFGTAVAGLIYAGVSFAHSPLQLLLCTAAISCFMPFRFVVLNTLFLQQLVSLGESKAGWYRGTHMLGMFLLGPLLGAYTVSTLGSSSSYRFIALAFGLTILLSPLLFARYAPRPVVATGSAWQALRAQVALLLQDRALARVSLVEGASQATSAFFTFFIPILGVHSAGMSAREASTLITAKGISYIFALFFLGGPLQRLGPGRGYAAGFAVIATGLALLGNTAQPPLLWLGSLILGLGLGSVQIATLTRYAQIGLRTGYGKVSGFNALVGPTGSVLGGLVGGNAAHWFGLPNVFLLAAGAFLLGCGGLLLGKSSGETPRT
jgi:predicted MFS family arabinose efflux permease